MKAGKLQTVVELVLLRVQTARLPVKHLIQELQLVPHIWLRDSVRFLILANQIKVFDRVNNFSETCFDTSFSWALVFTH